MITPRSPSADAVEGADEIDLDRARELAEIGRPALAEGLLGGADPRAVHEGVDGAEALDRGLEPGRHLFGLRDVARREERVLAHGLGHLSPGRGRQVQQRDAAPASEEPLGRGAPQSRGAAGDDRGRARNLHESVLLFSPGNGFPAAEHQGLKTAAAMPAGGLRWRSIAGAPWTRPGSAHPPSSRRSPVPSPAPARSPSTPKPTACTITRASSAWCRSRKRPGARTWWTRWRSRRWPRWGRCSPTRGS